MIQITQLNGDGTSFNYDPKPFKFPGGEIGIKIPLNNTQRGKERFVVKAWLRSSDDIMELLLAFDALRRQRGRPEITLYLGYLPYARQDRVCDAGEPLSIRVLTDLINMLDAKCVVACDLHSGVALPLLNNGFEVTQESILLDHVLQPDSLIPSLHDWWLVAPDEGARKKTEALAKATGAMGVVYGIKNRELSTGKITHTSILPEPKLIDHQSKLLVVDDICDGGRTFVELAKVLHETVKPDQLGLFVTHGIFSKGFIELDIYYDYILTTNTYNPHTAGDLRTDGLRSPKYQAYTVL